MGLTSKTSASFLSSSELNNNFGFVLDQFIQSILTASTRRVNTDFLTGFTAIDSASCTCLLGGTTGGVTTPSPIFATLLDQITGSATSSIWTVGGTTSVTNGYLEVAGANGFALMNGTGAIDFKTLTGNSRCLIIAWGDGPAYWLVGDGTSSVQCEPLTANGPQALVIDKALGKAYGWGTSPTGNDISALGNWYVGVTTSAFNGIARIYSVGYHGKSGGDTSFFQSAIYTLGSAAETGLITPVFSLEADENVALMSMSANSGSNFSEMAHKSLRTIAAPGSQGVIKIGFNLTASIGTGSSGITQLQKYGFAFDEAP